MTFNIKQLRHSQWMLLIVFIVYWFIFFPIIWFVVQPAAFVASNTSTLMYAIILIVLYLALHCMIYRCYKHFEQKRAKKLKPELPEGGTPGDMANMQRAVDASIFVRRKHLTSKPVETPKVPAESERRKSDDTDSNRYSSVTIPLHAKENEEEQVRFVSSYELFYDGKEFHDEV